MAESAPTPPERERERCEHTEREMDVMAESTPTPPERDLRRHKAMKVSHE